MTAINKANKGSDHMIAVCETTFSFTAEVSKLVLRKKICRDTMTKNKEFQLEISRFWALWVEGDKNEAINSNVTKLRKQ